MRFDGFCVVCNKMVEILESLKCRITNRKSRSGQIEAHKGNCPHCKSTVYKIIGH